MSPCARSGAVLICICELETYDMDEVTEGRDFYKDVERIGIGTTCNNRAFCLYVVIV